MKLLFPVYEFRPIKVLEDCMRYNGGKFIPDDGKYDLAFFGRHMGEYGYPEALYVEISYSPNILWSWDGGNWARHEPKHPNGNAWHYMLREEETKWGKDWERHKHPNEIAGRKAMDACSTKYSCANGGGPEFHIGDSYIKAGLVRRVDTKEIVKFPKVFKCMYCGEIPL